MEPRRDLPEPGGHLVFQSPTHRDGQWNSVRPTRISPIWASFSPLLIGTVNGTFERAMRMDLHSPLSVPYSSGRSMERHRGEVGGCGLDGFQSPTHRDGQWNDEFQGLWKQLARDFQSPTHRDGQWNQAS